MQTIVRRKSFNFIYHVLQHQALSSIPLVHSASFSSSSFSCLAEILLYYLSASVCRLSLHCTQPCFNFSHTPKLATPSSCAAKNKHGQVREGEADRRGLLREGAASEGQGRWSPLRYKRYTNSKGE